MASRPASKGTRQFLGERFGYPSVLTGPTAVAGVSRGSRECENKVMITIRKAHESRPGRFRAPAVAGW